MPEGQLEDIPRSILIQASRGDTQAFEIIYRAASDFVYRTAFRITNNSDDAEDVTQDVFIKVYQNLKNFQFRSSFKTWVYRITVNTALSTCKGKGIGRGTGKETSRRNDDVTVMDRRVSSVVEIDVDKKDNEKLVASLLRMLNPDQRACIVLREIEGLNYQEIAEVLSININTVRSRLKRARETLLAYKNSEVIPNGV
ncbi:MAG: RNA polymerase sigma factor [bacterium]